MRNADRLEQDEADTPVAAADALVVAIDASATDTETARPTIAMRNTFTECMARTLLHAECETTIPPATAARNIICQASRRLARNEP